MHDRSECGNRISMKSYMNWITRRIRAKKIRSEMREKNADPARVARKHGLTERRVRQIAAKT